LDAALLAALAFFAPFPTPWGKDHSLFGWKHRGAPAARLPVCRYSRFVPGLPFYSNFQGSPEGKSQSFISHFIFEAIVAPLKAIF
jgi:hypothetical protein